MYHDTTWSFSDIRWIMIAEGRRNQMIAPDNSQRLADILSEAGADVDLRWRNTGHGLTYEETREAREWLSGMLQNF